MKIRKDTVEKIFEHGEKERPIEACGYLAGRDNEIIKNYPMLNADESPEHFSLEPAEQFAVIRKIRQEGLELLASYHTHPASPARPSDEDIRLAFDTRLIYVIASLADGHRRIKAFKINGGRAVEEKLTIED